MEGIEEKEAKIHITLVSGHEHVGSLLQVLRQEISEREILLQEQEVGRVGGSYMHGPCLSSALSGPAQSQGGEGR